MNFKNIYCVGRRTKKLIENRIGKVTHVAKNAQKLGKEKRMLEGVVNTLSGLEQGISDSKELFEMAREEGDDESLLSIAKDSEALEKTIEEMEFRRMFSQPMDD